MPRRDPPLSKRAVFTHGVYTGNKGRSYKNDIRPRTLVLLLVFGGAA